MQSKDATVEVLKYLSDSDSNIFNQIDGHTKEQLGHIYDLTKSVIERYVNVRLHYICQKDTLEKKSKSKRQVFNKLNLFQGLEGCCQVSVFHFIIIKIKLLRVQKK